MDLSALPHLVTDAQFKKLVAILEFLEDYASPATREIGERTIASHIGRIPNQKAQEVTRERLARIKNGERDLYL
ncbi:MAG TPA: hypothetical protein VD969_06300 [Symbiobacteriaceae bacterium]|nr:hypothetical protein [Symbiobacteriaceae bacterium]